MAGIPGGAMYMVSLIIETAQAWMPSRSSSQLDLLCNGGGGRDRDFFGPLGSEASEIISRP